MTELKPRIVPLKFPDGNQSERLKRLRPFIRQSGDDRRKPWFLADRRLFDYMLVYVVEGTGVFTLEDEICPISRGDLFWVPPDTRHSMRGTGPEMHLFYLHFDLAYDEQRSRWNEVIPGGLTDLSPWAERMHPPVELPEIDALRGMIAFRGPHYELTELLEKICREHLRCSGYSPSLSGMLLELLELILRNITENSPDDVHSAALAEAAAYLRCNACKIVSLADVASRFGFSVSHFRRLFSQRYGLPPSAIIHRYRMKCACEFLSYGNCNVSETAERCGFKSIYSFSRAFRQYTGQPPGAYRNR